MAQERKEFLLRRHRLSNQIIMYIVHRKKETVRKIEKERKNMRESIRQKEKGMKFMYDKMICSSVPRIEIFLSYRNRGASIMPSNSDTPFVFRT